MWITDSSSVVIPEITTAGRHEIAVSNVVHGSNVKASKFVRRRIANKLRDECQGENNFAVKSTEHYPSLRAGEAGETCAGSS